MLLSFPVSFGLDEITSHSLVVEASHQLKRKTLINKVLIILKGGQVNCLNGALTAILAILETLIAKGVKGKLLAWIQDYFKDRSARFSF